MTARLILPAGAPRDEWLEARRAGVTASEIAALLGISPWQSPFNLYWIKQGVIPEDFDDDRLELGRHMEPYIASRFRKAHPDLHLVAPAGLWGSIERPIQLSTPDGLICEDAEMTEFPFAVWEGKTSGTYEDWGEDGTDEIPVYYRAQALWQMDVRGVTTAYVTCFFLHTQQTRTYVIGYDQTDIDLMRTSAAEFWERVQAEDPPEIDGHTATKFALKQLYPDVNDTEKAEVPADLATRYRTACAAVKRAEERKSGIENEIRAAMGDAKYAVDSDGQKVATRSTYTVAEHVRRASSVDKLIPARTKKEDAA